MIAKFLEPLIPEALVIADPVRDLAQGLGPQSVDALPSSPPFFYKARFSKNSQVLRHCWKGHFKGAGECQNGKVALSKKL
jgi:hypothetical protein